MKKVMSKLGHFLRVFWGVIFALCTVIYAVLAFTEPDLRPVMIVMGVVFGLLAILLLRKRKERTSTEPSRYTPQAPPEVLREMRKHYTVIQARDDARIMQESFHLAENTTDFEVFFSRLELAQKCAYTLLQAVAAGCKHTKNMRVVPACEAVLDNVQNLKTVFLENSYQKETRDATLLKTPAGQRRRLEAYLARLQAHEDGFMDVEDVYLTTVQKVQKLAGIEEKAGEG